MATRAISDSAIGCPARRTSSGYALFADFRSKPVADKNRIRQIHIFQVSLEGGAKPQSLGNIARDKAPRNSELQSSATQQLFETGRSKKFGSIAKVATRKLARVAAAETLAFLASPPGSRLEALQGDRAGQHSIRINDQWRMCFRWTDTGPADVEIVDYHY